MTTTATRDRLRSLIDVLLESLDEPGRGDELASRAYLSRFHFDRLVAAGLGEPPAAFRRRLLLERAAFELTAHGTAVIEAALGAGYGSPEAFARAFRRAFGVSPSRFRGDFRLPAPNGTVDDLRERHERAGEEFARAVRDIRDRNAWDTAFVDALCDPPETFTFGAMVGHVLTWSAHRQKVIIGALRNLGTDLGTGDPIEWERRAA